MHFDVIVIGAGAAGRVMVLATGGLSFSKPGATPTGHDWARQFGLKLLSPRPGLVPFT